MSIRKIRPLRSRTWALIAISSLFFFNNGKVSGDNMVRLSGHLSAGKLLEAKALGPKASGDNMKLAIALKPRNQAGLDDFLKRLNDPADPLFHRYLSPQEFADRFGPSEDDVRDVTRHLERHGLRVENVHPNHLVIEAEGPTSSVESAFEVQVHNYRLKSGRIALAANNDPNVPAEISQKVRAVAGLNTFSVRVPHARQGMKLAPRGLAPNAGINDYLTPANIKSTYSFGALTQTGAGETLALFELDNYTPSDITKYVTQFGLPAPTLQNVLVGGYNGALGDGAIEVTLDIELAIALAPGLAKIMVYEGPNTDSGVLATYSKIANDNSAGQVSISWGASEDETSASFMAAENTIFQQMAAQGQSVFAAAGDSGAYDKSSDPTVLAVDDPASQPYVTGVGGTKVYWTAGGAYSSESAWGNESNRTGGGGGVSKQWSIPSWQVEVGTSSNGHSTTKRMVPDVALAGDPSTGYAIAFEDSWYVVGGTSCGAPLWAAFAALVNQKRVADGHARLGFANPSLYQVARSAEYPNAFHDVANFTTNLKFPAAVDYDLATGWGSFKISNLHALLTANSLPSVLPAPSVPGPLDVRAGQ